MLRAILRYEISRAFKTHGFILALIVGCMCTIIHFSVEVVPLRMKLDEYMSYGLQMNYPFGVCTSWIGEGSSLYSYIYFFIVPILATLPYADSHYLDLESNFISFILTRVDRRKLYICKYIGVLTSGAVVSTIPLVLNWILTISVLPNIKPEATSYLSLLVPKSSMSELYVKHINLYIIVSLFVVAIFSGIIAGVALVISYYSKHWFVVISSPLLLCIFLSMTFDLLGLQEWQYVNFIHPGYPEPRIIPALITIVVIFFIVWIEFFIKGIKEDIC